LVVADTAIWIDYLQTKQSALGSELTKLIGAGRVALVGVVLAEILRGIRGPEERDLIERRLEGATFLEMSKAAWRRAGIISSDLDSRGLPIPMTDVFIAALALEDGHEIYTRDKHFERIPGLRLYQAEGDSA
jgi:predicted nucleic acid-binding protein